MSYPVSQTFPAPKSLIIGPGKRSAVGVKVRECVIYASEDVALNKRHRAIPALCLSSVQQKFNLSLSLNVPLCR